MNSILLLGGSGSFGQAFTRRLLDDPFVDRIGILSRGEFAQAEMAAALRSNRVRFFIGDVRDRVRLRRAMEGMEVVVNAAALKRIEVGFYNPTEMIETNVRGAQMVIEAAMDAGVEKVVQLSTDKAWQPISPYGHSKALAEVLFRNAYQGRTKFSVCRYGNIWQSRGSVVPIWQAVLREHDTVPVTDPDATRFCMMMDEAIDLVLNTIETMQGGELNIPPDLPAYRLGDLAEAMGAKVKIIGLPEWEKRHEGLRDGQTSDIARRMTVDELRGHLDENELHHPGQDRQCTAAR